MKGEGVVVKSNFFGTYFLIWVVFGAYANVYFCVYVSMCALYRIYAVINVGSVVDLIVVFFFLSFIFIPFYITALNFHMRAKHKRNPMNGWMRSKRTAFN